MTLDIPDTSINFYVKLQGAKVRIKSAMKPNILLFNIHNTKILTTLIETGWEGTKPVSKSVFLKKAICSQYIYHNMAQQMYQ